MKIDETKHNRHISTSKCDTAVPKRCGRVVHARVAEYFCFDVQPLRRSDVHLYGNLRLINNHSVRSKPLDKRCLELIVSDKASPLMHMEKSPIKKGRKAIFTRRQYA